MTVLDRLERIEVTLESLQSDRIALLDAREAAAFLKLTRKGLYTRVHRGHIRPWRLGGKLYFNKLELIRALQPADDE